MMAKLVAWESLIGWFACVNFIGYKVWLVAIVTCFKGSFIHGVNEQKRERLV